MTAHEHTSYVEGCHRCELNKDEAFNAKVDAVMEELQSGRICSIGTCPYCRAQAEAIVRKLSD